MGGVGPEKKSSRKNLNFFFGPNRVINPLVHDFKKVIFFISQKIFFEKKNISPYRGGVVPQGGDCRGCSPPGGAAGGCRANLFWEKGPNRGINPIWVEVL